MVRAHLHQICQNLECIIQAISQCVLVVVENSIEYKLTLH